MSGSWLFFAIVYALYWLSQAISYGVCRSGSTTGQRLSRFVWNSRIDLFRRPLYMAVLEAMERKRYWPAVGLVILVNARMVVMQWLLGMLFLAPLLAVFSGVIAGAIFSLGERRTVFPYGMINMVFEWGAFAAGAAAGLGTTWSWLSSSVGFGQALTSNLPFLALGLVFLAMNGLVEASGPVFFGIEGIRPLEAVRSRSYR